MSAVRNWALCMVMASIGFAGLFISTQDYLLGIRHGRIRVHHAFRRSEWYRMNIDEDCDLCKLEARGITAVQFSVLEESDVVVCERHLRLLRDQ